MVEKPATDPMKASQSTCITVISTGGTIAGVGAIGLNTGYTAGQLGPQALLAGIPAPEGVITHQFQSPFSAGSQDLTDTHLVLLRQAILDASLDPKCHAILVTHGTDTLEETAFFLHLTLPSQHKPVVLTAAMRPASAISADGAGNLRDAMATLRSLCLQHRGGVWTLLANRLYGALDVHKGNALAPDAFHNQRHSATVLDGLVTWLSNPVDEPWTAGRYAKALDNALTRWVEKGTAIHDDFEGLLPEVPVVACHQAMHADRIASMLKPMPAGVVVVGVGHGAIPQSLHPLVNRLLKKGCWILRASRTPTGPVLDAAENPWLTHTFGGKMLSAGRLSPWQGKVALQLALLDQTSESNGKTSTQSPF